MRDLTGAPSYEYEFATTPVAEIMIKIMEANDKNYVMTAGIEEDEDGKDSQRS